MDAVHHNKNSSVSRKKIFLICISAFLIILAVAAIACLSAVLNSNTIYKGVQVLGTDVQGLTREELLALLENDLSAVLSNFRIDLHIPGYSRTVYASDLDLRINISAMADNAYSMGRKGSYLDRLIEILKLRNNPVSTDMKVDFGSDKFDELLDDVCRDVFREVIPSNIVVTDDQAILCTGIPGQQADREQLRKEIIKRIQTLDFSSVEIPILKMPPPPIDIETTLATLNRDPVDAEFVKLSRTEYEIIPHQAGLRLDRSKLMDVVSYVESRDNDDYEEIVLPVEFIAPAITEDKLRSQLFRDTLSSYTTYFKTTGENNYNRSINIGLAAKSIDGTILMPGEVFSFNDVVGPRTAAKGYRTAHIFVAGRITDGTGGGVCQVSTTLYNAVLRADLEVLERHNHMFTVGYVPLGHDAAVSYGYADLVFKNTTGHPLRISAVVSPNNSLNIKIISTNDYPGRKVELATRTISTIPIEVQYVDDSTMPQGTAIVEENGMEGYVVDTYIRVYNGDILIREEKLHRSVYQMYPRKIRRGTAPTAEITE
ncbi:MAG TPA: hypothetical protein GX501_01095 [Clostridiaceae bacterium]|nr:hypothetical protein [Clostridiaceae bacterium]